MRYVKTTDTSLLTKTKNLLEIIKKKGGFYVIKITSKLIYKKVYLATSQPCNLLFYKLFRSKTTFKFLSNSYKYFYHHHNNTWKNERCIEIPIVMNYINQFKSKNILEIGNVLSHYFSFKHTIVDKYEKGNDVINADIIGFKSKTKYDLIVSISTLEHVGYDDIPQDPYKILAALNNIKDLLNVNGTAVITLPLGYNKNMDQLIRDNKMPFTQQIFLKRISKDNQWQEVNYFEVSQIKYNSPYHNANGLMIGILNQPLKH